MGYLYARSKIFENLSNKLKGDYEPTVLAVIPVKESYPDFPMIYPNGNHGYDFYFQDHLEKWFDYLYNLKN